MTTQADMRFHVEVAVRYHRRRAAFLERASSLMSVVLLGGAAAFIGMVGEATLFSKLIALCIVVVGIVQIVCQTDCHAASHRLWLRQWNEILAEIKQAVAPDQLVIGRWIDRQAAIEAECVGEMKALANDCYNRTMNALDLAYTPFAITRWQRFWMQFVSFENASYK